MKETYQTLAVVQGVDDRNAPDDAFARAVIGTAADTLNITVPRPI